MLTDKDFENISMKAVNLYSNLELQIVEEIATRIANFGYANTVVINNLRLAQEMGFLYKDIIALVAEHSNKNSEEIYKVFENAGEKSLKFDDKVYKRAGLYIVPLKQSKSIQRMLRATAELTSGDLSNLCKTTANTAQTQFYNAINKSYLEVSTGAKSYTQSIVDALIGVGEKGATVKYPSGVERSLESAVRTNIVTSINQTCGKLQEIRAKEVGWDLMEITAHAGARPDHAKWQGKIVSLSGKKGYLSKRSIGYGKADGFKGINCHHEWLPYVEGSVRTYTQKDLQEINNKTVKYKGKEISLYEATKKQRELERIIRSDKKRVATLNKALSNTKDVDVVAVKSEIASARSAQQKHTKALNDFLKETSLEKDNSRLKI